MSVTRKLVSAKGTLLGTITIPEGYDPYQSQAEQDRRFYLPPPMPHCVPYDPSDDMRTSVGVISKFEHQFCDAVLLWGVSLEEFEKLPGCSFSPGAAYLRSIME